MKRTSTRAQNASAPPPPQELPSAVTTADRALLSDVLETIQRSEAPSGDAIVAGVRQLLGASKAIAYGVTVTGGSARIDFLHADGMHEAGLIFASWVETTGVMRFGAYDPERAARAQRNVARTLEDLGRAAEEAPVRAIWGACDLDGFDLIRVLVCDGPRLLAWVGAFREAPFGARERALLEALVPTMKRRYGLDEHLRMVALGTAAIDAAIEALPSPAFIVSPWGTIQEANAAGRALLDAERPAVLAALEAAVRGQVPGIDVLPLEAPGLPGLRLALVRGSAPEVGARAGAAARAWQLTPRQREVVQHLARGYPNKKIAALLGCSEKAVELHVTGILKKAKCASRAELVARIWASR